MCVCLLVPTERPPVKRCAIIGKKKRDKPNTHQIPQTHNARIDTQSFSKVCTRGLQGFAIAVLFDKVHQQIPTITLLVKHDCIQTCYGFGVLHELVWFFFGFHYFVRSRAAF